MQFMRSIHNHALLDKGCVATVGNFDGVHRGHQQLLRQLRAEAERLHLPLVVVIFEPQAREFFSKQTAPPRLSSLRDKLDRLRACNVDIVCCLRFNSVFAAQSAEDFAQTVLFQGLNIKYLLVGQDFRFGRQRLGDVALLQNMTHQTERRVEVFPDITLHAMRISSTQIREALQRDELRQVTDWLGQPYSLSARVMHGQAMGRGWGVPTANLRIDHTRVSLQGIYCVHVKRASGAIQEGVAYIGRRPTLDDGPCVLEVHLLDTDESLYSERLQVFFLHKLRDDVKFASVDAMVAAIHADVVSARAYFSTHRNLTV
jgi:riboflavin kinase/FMN adenylyltransferase